MVLLVKGYKYYQSLCLFSEVEVVCVYRKREGFSVHVCLNCRRYGAYLRMMAEEDERVMAEIDEIREQYSVG